MERSRRIGIRLTRRLLAVVSAAATLAGVAFTVLAQPPADAATTAAFAGYETAFQSDTDHLTMFGDTGFIASDVAMEPGAAPSMISYLTSEGESETAFVGTDGFLWKRDPNGAVGRAGAGLCVAPGTSPAISAQGWMIAFHACGDVLWTYDRFDGALERDNPMRPGTSPAMAPLWFGGSQIAFVGRDGFLWTMDRHGHAGRAGAKLCVAPGTSPSIAADHSDGWKIAFHACGDHLWTIDSTGNAVDTGAIMAPNTSPSIAWLRSPAGYETVFVHSDGLLYRAFPDSNWFQVGAGLCVAAGTSPSIATDSDFGSGTGWKAAFHACGDHLWTVDAAGRAADTRLLIAPSTNPSITAMRTFVTVDPTPTSPTPSSTGSTGSGGDKTFTVFNCKGSPSSGRTPPLGIWTRDVSANAAFTENTTLGNQWGTFNCPAVGQPFVFTPTSNGHVYELRAVDFQAPGCVDNPTISGCIAADVTFTADTVRGIAASTTVG
jgi:hypothetical protein